jgi:hypothetical protein
MHLAGVAFAVAITALPGYALLSGAVSRLDTAQAQSRDRRMILAAVAKKSAAKQKDAPAPKAPGAAKAPAAGPVPPGYATMPLAERVALQFDLAWSGDYNGLINGEINDKTVAAVKALQTRNKFKVTGILAPPERALLASSVKSKQAQVGWTWVEDRATGATVGLPQKQAPNVTQTKTGTRWASAQGQVQVETWRIREPGATLSSVFEQQKKEPTTRRLEVNLLRPDFFILSGTQGLKKFYVRAAARDSEVRGLTILWDPATEGIMDPVVVAMSSAFAPFGEGLPGLGPPPRRKVEYGTGVVVTAAGDILTDRQVIDGCNVIQIGGYGDANRVAEDGDLALVRLYGAPAFTPAALAHEGARPGDLTLAGIADPQGQGGGSAVTTLASRLTGDALQPAPQPGFAGAAVLDAQGRFYGIVSLKTPVVASAGATAPLLQAAVTPVAAVRRFLDAQGVTPTTGRPGGDAIKPALVRVICVRK